MLDHLDTSINLRGSKGNVQIGPEHKLAQNTIFFNKPFRFDNNEFNYFRIKGSFLQHFMVDSSAFKQESIYIDSTDFDSLFITNSTFGGSVVFESVYIKDFKFVGNIMPGELIFWNCTIPNLDLSSSHFEKDVTFINCKLGNLDFGRTHFTGLLRLSYNNIEGRVNFQYTNLGSKLDLKAIIPSANTKFWFTGVLLPDTLDLSENRILPDSVNLTGVSDIQLRRSKLLLNGTNVSNIMLNYDYFRIIFPSKTVADEKERVYRGVLQNLQTHSYQKSYEDLDVEYRRFKTKQGSFGFLWRIPEWWWNYGYDRERVFIITFWSLVIFIFINFLGLNFLVDKVYPVGNIPVYFRQWNGKRLWFAIVYTLVIFFSLYLRIDKINFQQKRGSSYVLFMYVYGLICLAYMANYIIQR